MLNDWKNKLSEIVDGWKNVIWTDDKVEKLAYDRAKICSSCEHNKNLRCQKCGCPLVSKLRSTKKTNKCPINKW